MTYDMDIEKALPKDQDKFLWLNCFPYVRTVKSYSNIKITNWREQHSQKNIICAWFGEFIFIDIDYQFVYYNGEPSLEILL